MKKDISISLEMFFPSFFRKGNVFLSLVIKFIMSEFQRDRFNINFLLHMYVHFHSTSHFSFVFFLPFFSTLTIVILILNLFYSLNSNLLNVINYQDSRFSLSSFTHTTFDSLENKNKMKVKRKPINFSQLLMALLLFSYQIDSHVFPLRPSRSQTISTSFTSHLCCYIAVV